VTPAPTVRLATSADRDAVLRLANALLVELGGEAIAPHDVAAVYLALVEGDAGFVALSEVSAVPRAVCTVSFVEALRSRGRYAIVQEMFVEPAMRGSGVGVALLRFVSDEAIAAGCRFVELGTPLDGARQIAFYERAGFARVGERLRWMPA
jgi:GNAT superfamily N-acetyltransferase